MIPYLFVIIPLGIYISLFLYETYVSIRRAVGVTKHGSTYLHATWEVTHTILIIAVTNFVWLFSDIANEIGKAVYWGLIFAGFFFIVRAVVYLYLFFVKQEGKTSRSQLVDYVFAGSHLGVLFGLIFAIIRSISVLLNHNYVINEQFIPWMWPGLVVTLAVSAIPILHLYRTKKS